MYKLIFLILLICWSVCGICQSSFSDDLSKSMARRISDTMGLTKKQEMRIHEVNKRLASEKESVFHKYATRDSLQLNLQRIENMRDSLYREVLPAEKYKIYNEKKRNLVGYK